MNVRYKGKRRDTVLQEVKPMRTTRNQFHNKRRSRTPAKPCLLATFLLRFQQLLQLWRSSVLAKHRSFDHEHARASIGSLPEGMQKGLHLLLTPLGRQVSWG